MVASLRIRKSLNVVIHVVLVGLSMSIAVTLHHGYGIWLQHQRTLALIIGVAILLKISAFAYARMFSGWWRYVSLPDLGQLFKGNLVGSTGLLGVLVAFPRTFEPLSFELLVIDLLCCFLATVGVRVLVRFACEKHCQFQKLKQRALRRVLVVGAGAIGQSIVKEIRACTRLNQRVIGYVDDDPQRQNQSFQGAPVLGKQHDLGEICDSRNIDTVIVARSAICPRSLGEIVDLCHKANVEVKILPAMGDILRGEVTIKKIRDIQIEDLLGRAPVALDTEAITPLVADKVVLVTGAGGSIGSEICRQVAGLAPAALILFDHGETPLFHIERQLTRTFPHLTIHPVIGDVKDRRRVEWLFRHFAPEVVFHAAAYKHVRMSEINPAQALSNNVFGTYNVAREASQSRVESFVMISTDKAVNPTNIMGASKRLAEMVVQSIATQSKVRFVTVRFGNVLGSNGSVVEVFREQIANGGPVTVTHPEVTRFFMTIPEAVNLVLHAGCIGHSGNVFLLDMGEPVKIINLAEELIRLSGLTPHEDIEVRFVGLAPGEKLYEELLLAEEGASPTRHAKIWTARYLQVEGKRLDADLQELGKFIDKHDIRGMLHVLQRAVPAYQPEVVAPAPQSEATFSTAELNQPFVPAYLVGSGSCRQVSAADASGRCTPATVQ